MSKSRWIRVSWQDIKTDDQVRVRVVKFANGEIKPIIENWQKLKNQKVWLKVKYYPNINGNLMLTLLTVDAIRRIGIKKIRLEALWFPYSPQDRVFVKGEPLSMELVVRLLEKAGVDEFVVWELHKIKSLKFFTKPVIHQSFIPLFVEQLKARVNEDWMVVSPDVGGKERAKDMAKLLGLKWGYWEKERDRRTGKIKFGELKGVNVVGKNIILIDDFSARGGTILSSARKLKEKGAKQILVCVGYWLMEKERLEQLKESEWIDETVSK